MKTIKKFEEYNFILEKSYFISDSNDYGSFEGIVHSDMDKIKNWFDSRKIDYNKYINIIELPVAFLNNINVDENFRNRGFGNQLYYDFEQECYDNDAKCIILESDSGENQLNDFKLDSWYESLDFEIIGTEGGNSIMIKKL